MLEEVRKSDCQRHIKIAIKPAQPIQKSLPAPGLLPVSRALASGMIVIKRELRQQKARIFDQIKARLDREKPILLPRSPMGEAITYALNQWDALCRYTEQGYLNIDNNAAERALKRVAIGRKNWLFAGHDDAGRSHARLYTLIASAQRHGIDPHAYLRSVLAKIATTPMSQLDQFLPEKWKAEDAAEPAHSSTKVALPDSTSTCTA